EARQGRDPPGGDHEPMIVELGHFALILALLVAVFQMVVPAWGAYVRDPRLMATAEPAALCQLGLLMVAFLTLINAHVSSDFSVANVVANSHSTKPLLYRISGVWGNHEGSMVLWVLILALFGAAVAAFGRNLPPTLKANVLAVQASIAVAFCLFLYFCDAAPFRAARAAPGGRNRPQSDLAAPRARVPPAVSLHGLRRLLDRLLVRHRDAHRGPARRRLGALGAPVDAARVDVP